MGAGLRVDRGLVALQVPADSLLVKEPRLTLNSQARKYAIYSLIRF
jgi:hypothetical protein